jgi:hypothetical protein
MRLNIGCQFGLIEEEEMKIDLKSKVRTIGNKVFQTVGEDGKLKDWDCELKELIYGALTGQLQQDFQLSVADKMKIYRLAKRIDQANGSVALESEDISLIKERAAKIYGNHQFGVMVDLLEGDLANDVGYHRAGPEAGP